MGPLVDALFAAGYGPPDTYLQIDSAGSKLVHGDSHPWKLLIAEAKLGFGHLHHFSLMQENVVELQ